jgi:hypothetical protein
MTQPRGFPSWEELYKQDVIEKLPWYWPALDPDLDAALARYGARVGARARSRYGARHAGDRAR